MLYKLTIGMMDFIIDGDSGVSTIMRTMTKARMVHIDARYRGGEIELFEGGVEVALKAEPTLKWVKGVKGKLKESIVLDPALPGGSKRLIGKQMMGESQEGK